MDVEKELQEILAQQQAAFELADIELLVKFAFGHANGAEIFELFRRDFYPCMSKLATNTMDRAKLAEIYHKYRALMSIMKLRLR